jgi:hypothetical protein
MAANFPGLVIGRSELVHLARLRSIRGRVPPSWHWTWRLSPDPQARPGTCCQHERDHSGPATDASLDAASPSVKNGGTDTCWFVITDDGRYGYATSFFGDGRISSYRVDPGGRLELLEADAGEDAGLGASDLTLSMDSSHLYQLNSFDGTINAFRVRADGGLRLIQTVQATTASEMAARIGLAGF